MSAIVSRRTTTRCVSVSWAFSCRCPSPAVCSHAERSVAACARGQPLSTSVSTSCLSLPVLPRQLCQVVCWVGILLDVIGGVESTLWEGCYLALTLEQSCENRATPCVKVPGSSRVKAPTWVGSRSCWLRSDPPMGWWLGLAPDTLEFWVRFPNERNQGKQGATLC
jgi:hypothetical protein